MEIFKKFLALVALFAASATVSQAEDTKEEAVAKVEESAEKKAEEAVEKKAEEAVEEKK